MAPVVKGLLGKKRVLRELVDNDRVLGGFTPYCAERAKQLYSIFVQGDCFITDSRTAEMSKITESAYRDVNIAFANELSLICDPLDIDVWDLIKLANRHPRVNILESGPGVGGHCIPVDPWFIVHQSPLESRLIHCARKVNDSKSDYVFEKIRKKAERFSSANIAYLGLAFNPDVDDLRESPALKILSRLIVARVGNITSVKPNIEKLPEGFEEITLSSVEQSLNDADVVVVLVKHKEFAAIDPDFSKTKFFFILAMLSKG